MADQKPQDSKTPTKNSVDSLTEATRTRAEFSGHGPSLGASGHREISLDPDNCAFLRQPGQSIAVTPSSAFESLYIGVEWEGLKVKKTGLLGKVIKKVSKKAVDLDLGCLYELTDGTRGALQAFGKKHGSFDQPPYISLSSDERSGNAQGHDEYILVNGRHWDKVKRLLIYIYIYDGAANWRQINPKLFVDVPGEEDLVVTLGAHNDALDLCAVGGLEQVRGGIKLTNYTEYFPGHQEMDRAFGFGLRWDDGEKE